MIDEEKSFVAMCKFLLWLFTAFVITFIGISGVFAETTTQTFSTFNTTAESLSSSIQCNNNICVVYGVTQYDYQMNFEWGSVSDKTCQNASTLTGKLSLSRTSFGINNNDFKWSNVYIVNNNNTSNCNYQVGSNDTTFTCTVDNLKPNFKIGYTLNSMGGTYTYDSIIYRNVDISCDTSTTQIIENNNANTQNVINNNNQNTQDIINNNDENTNKIIDENKKNFNDCRDSNNLWGNLNWQSGTYSYFKLPKENTYYTLSMKLKEGKTIPSGLYVRFTNTGDYNSDNMTFTQIIGNGKFTSSSITNYLNNTFLDYISVYPSSYKDNLSDYFDIMLNEGTSALDYEEYGKEICVNKLDEQNKTSKGILGKLKDLFDTLFSNDDADVSGLDNMVGWLPPGPVDSIINLPLSFFNSLTNTLTGTCRSVSLTIPFVNQTLVLPCFDSFMSQYLTGFNTLWTFVGVTLSVFILYYYLLSLYKWVDDTLTFRENNLPGYYGDNWGGGA